MTTITWTATDAFGNTTVGTQLITVLAPAPAPVVVTVAATDSTGGEAGANPIVFRVTRTDATASVSVALTWAGSATYGTDYRVDVTGGALAADGRTLTLAAGALAATLTVTPIDDALVEGAESVVLSIGTGTGYTVGTPGSASGSIADDDVAPPPPPPSVAYLTIAAADAIGAENPLDTISFVVTRTGRLDVALSIKLSWSGTAQFGPGKDYTVTVIGGTLDGKLTTLTLAAGVASATIVITPVRDNKTEPAETVVLTLLAGSGYSLTGPTTATGTITDTLATPAALGDTRTAPIDAASASGPVVFTEPTVIGSVSGGEPAALDAAPSPAPDRDAPVRAHPNAGIPRRSGWHPARAPRV